jgi:hypothetical protein
VHAKLKEMNPANLNRSKNKPGNQNPKEQTNIARKSKSHENRIQNQPHKEAGNCWR